MRLKHLSLALGIVLWMVGVVEAQNPTVVTAGIGLTNANGNKVGPVTIDVVTNSATVGQVFTFTNASPWLIWTASSGGVPTTRTLTAGTGLSGGGDLSANRTFNLANTAVIAATYGDATHIPQVIVDAQGRITFGTNFTFSSGAGDAVLANTQTFSGPTNTFSGTINATGVINLPATTSATAGIINVAGVRFLSTFAGTNLFIGKTTANLTLTGYRNVAIGDYSFTNATSAIQCTLVGTGAGRQITTASGATLIGDGAGNAIGTSGGATAVGFEAGRNLGGNGTAVGYRALWNSSGTTCVAVGIEAGGSSGSMVGITAVGASAGGSTSSSRPSYYSTFLGNNAGNFTTTAITNVTAIGLDADVITANTCVIGTSLFASEMQTLCLGTNSDCGMPTGSLVMNAGWGGTGVITNCAAMYPKKISVNGGSVITNSFGGSFTVDPPSITAASTWITNVTAAGVVAGSPIILGTTGYSDPVLSRAICTNNGSVMLIFYNGNIVSPVDPASQTVTIRSFQ